MRELIFPEPEPHPGPRTTASARAALAQLQDGLCDAHRELLAAGRVEWVSVAADLYRGVVDDALVDVTRLNLRVADAGAAVLRHTGASDDRRAAEEAACPDGIIDQLVGWVR